MYNTLQDFCFNLQYCSHNWQKMSLGIFDHQESADNKKINTNNNYFTYHKVSWKTSMPVCKHQENKRGVQTANILLKKKVSG